MLKPIKPCVNHFHSCQTTVDLWGMSTLCFKIHGSQSQSWVYRLELMGLALQHYKQLGRHLGSGSAVLVPKREPESVDPPVRLAVMGFRMQCRCNPHDLDPPFPQCSAIIYTVWVGNCTSLPPKYSYECGDEDFKTYSLVVMSNSLFIFLLYFSKVAFPWCHLWIN